MSDQSVTVGPKPATVHLNIYRGTRFYFPFQLLDDGSPVDFSGYTLLAKIVTEDDGTEVADLDPDWTDDNTGLGEIDLGNSTTGNLTAGRYVWNLRAKDSSDVIIGPFCEGSVKVNGKRSTSDA